MGGGSLWGSISVGGLASSRHLKFEVPFCGHVRPRGVKGKLWTPSKMKLCFQLLTVPFLLGFPNFFSGNINWISAGSVYIAARS